MKAAKKIAMSSTAPAPVQAFQVVVGPGESIGTFSEGDVLSNAKVRREFFELHIAKLYDENVVKRLAEIKTDAIDARLKACDVSDIGDEAENNVRMADLVEAPFMLADSSNVPSQRVLKTSGAYAGLAATWGRMVDTQTEGALKVGIKGLQDADACPIVTCHNLERQFGKLEKDGEVQNVLIQFPPMGSKYRGPGAKGNKAPDGYRLPSDKDDSPTALPIWNGPWDKYKVQPLNAPDYDGDFINEFTASTPDGEYWSSYVECVKDAIGSVDLTANQYARLEKDTIAAINALRLDGSTEAKAELDGMLSEAAFQYNRRKTWYAKAISLYQATNRVSDRFNVDVVLAGVQLKSEPLIEAARRRKPYMLKTEIPSEKDPKKVKDVVSNPQTLSFILGLARKAHTLPGNSTIPKLVEKKRGTKKGTPVDSKDRPMIQTIDQFQNALSMLHVYCKTADKTKMILDRTNDATNGPEFCSALCTVYDTIQEVVMVKGVRERGLQHDADVAKALGEKTEASKQVTVDPKTGKPPIAA